MSLAAAGRALVLVGGCALAGCITSEYAPIGTKGSQFGYSDARNADGSYTIRVVAMTATQAHEYWDRRAAELCGNTDYRKNIFRAEIPIVTTTGYAVNAYNPAYGGSYSQDVYGALILEGYLHCEPPAQTAAAQPTSETNSAPTETAASSTP